LSVGVLVFYLCGLVVRVNLESKGTLVKMKKHTIAACLVLAVINLCYPGETIARFNKAFFYPSHRLD
jgi:hypothetical protein